MSKSNKKRTPMTAARAAANPSPLQPKTTSTNKLMATDKKNTKQSRVIEMLRLPAGTTIAGWQQHSVRGFFAGIVQKKLGLKLKSEKIDGNRIYRVASASDAGASHHIPGRASA